MSTPPREPSEEEMRAAYEAELKRISTADVILQTAVSLINLAGRRLGRVPGAEDERDLGQVRDAIDAVRGLMPVLERTVGPEIGPLREALSQLQMAYARETQAEPAQSGEGGAASGQKVADPAGASGPEDKDRGADAAGEESPGPAQSSGRLWIPGQ
jgi:hypothetical protein